MKTMTGCTKGGKGGEQNFNIRGQSDIKGSLLHMACAQHLDVTSIYIDTSGRGEVAMLALLFSIHVSKLSSEQNGQCD
jgi:hypothetical protein